MSRKRAMFPIVYGSGCDGNKGSLNCIRELEDRRRVSFVPWSKSKLFLTLFNNVRNFSYVNACNINATKTATMNIEIYLVEKA